MESFGFIIRKENKYTDGKIPKGWYKGRKMEYYKK